MPRKKEPFKEIGYPSVHMSNGMVLDDFLYELRGREGIRTYQQMSENEATISTMLFVIEMMIRSTTWQLTPAEEDNTEAEKYKEIVEEILFNDMDSTWDDVLSKSLTCLPYGWAYLEILWKKRVPISIDEDGEVTESLYNDGYIGLEDIKLRSQTTLYKWELSENKKRVTGMWQESTIEGESRQVLIPMDKAIHVRVINKNDSPEGRSLLRGAYETWFYLKNVRYQENIAIERELNGLPVMTLPQELIINANAGNTDAVEALNSYEKLVRDVKFNEQGGAMIPSDTFLDVDGNPTTIKKYEFELMTSQGTRNIDTDKTITRYQKDILRTIALQFLYMESGSRARSENESDFFLTSINGWNEALADTYNKQLIPKITKINGFNQDMMPKITATDIKPVDVDQLTTGLQALAAAGAPLFPNIELLNEVLSIFGLSEVEEQQIEYTEPLTTGEE
ncbi:MAG: hypothetical protein GY760_24740 [Deltaproteobacteria bacterium]|nr:hypothetical protein [Deltaproteobacteria bacterium]